MTETKTRRELERRASAFREAGHAVVAWNLQIMLMPVSILRRRAGRNVWDDALRNVDLDWLRDNPTSGLVDRLARVLLAGPLAQRVFAPRAPRGAKYRERVHAAEVLLGAVTPSLASRRARKAALERSLRGRFTRGPVRRATEYVGNMLCERRSLSAAEVTRAIARHLDKPRG